MDQKIVLETEAEVKLADKDQGEKDHKSASTTSTCRSLGMDESLDRSSIDPMEVRDKVLVQSTTGRSTPNVLSTTDQ